MLQENESGKARNPHLVPKLPLSRKLELKKPTPQRNLSRRYLLGDPVIVKKRLRKVQLSMAPLLMQVARAYLPSLFLPKPRAALHPIPVAFVAGDVEEGEGGGGEAHQGLDDEFVYGQ